MIFSILQRNSLISFILFPLVVAGLWALYLIEPHMTLYYYDLHPMPLYKPLLLIYNLNQYVGLLSMFTAMALGMILMSYINSIYRMFEKRSSIYLFLYILFASIFPQFQQFNPMPFATVFILMGIYSIYKLYKNEYELRAVFEAGFCFAIASLFYVQSLFLSVFIFAGILHLVPFNWRQWISAIFGIITPYLFVFAWAFIDESLGEILQTIEANVFVWHSTEKISLPFYFTAGFISIIFIGALLFSFSGTLKKVALQKYYTLQFLLLVLICILFLVVPGVGIEIFYVSIIPLSFYFTNYLLSMRNWLIPEIIILLLIGLRVMLFVI